MISWSILDRCELIFAIAFLVETSLYRYDMSSNGRKIDRICAGTFGAPVCEWVPGYPLQHNLLKIADNQLTAYTHRREELNASWF